MATKEHSIVESSLSPPVGSDVVAGVALALVGIVHLFVLQFGGGFGLFLLLVFWPFLAGAAGTVYAHRSRPERGRDLELIGPVTGVFGAVLTALVVFLFGLVGVWSAFIFETFGVELVPVTLGLAILLVIPWTVFGFVGGYVTRTALESSSRERSQ